MDGVEGTERVGEFELKSRLRKGDQVGPYRLERLLGVGFAGEVHEAVHQATGLHVALKYLHSEHAGDEHRVSRFSAEATTLFGLSHGNVVRVLDAGWHDAIYPWMALELLEGQTLGELLGRQRRLSPPLALHYACEIGWGIAAAHEMRVIHRDLKPDNVFVTRDGRIVVLDFSAAKFLTHDLRTTKPPEMTCTVAYAPPELLQGEQADARIDVYSLGLMLWQMLAGFHPFERHFGKGYALINAQFTEFPRSLAEVVGLPAYFDELLKPSLAKLTTNRYATIVAFNQAILRVKQRFEDDLRRGLVFAEAPPGEPAIVDDPRKRRQYQAPEPVPLQDTAPVMPSKRIAIARAALPSEPPEVDDDHRSSFQPPSPRASSEPEAVRRSGPMGTVRLPVEDLTQLGRQAPTVPRALAPFDARRSPPVVGPITPEPMTADTLAADEKESEESARPTRVWSPPRRRISLPTFALALLACVLASVSVTWWRAGSARPALEPGTRALPSVAPPDSVTLQADPPPSAGPAPSSIAPPPASVTPPPTASPKTAPSAAPPARTAAPRPSAAPKPPPAKPKPPAAGGPLFTLPGESP
jgi:serine/threonine-protein kinase